MSKKLKLIYLVSFVLVLGLVNSASADLVGHWKFDEGSGTIAYDSSGNGNDGTLQGDPQWVAGMIGSGALSFDGTDGYVEIGDDASLSLTDALTITVWVKVSDLDTYYFLVCKQPSGTARDGFPGNYEFRIQVNTGALQFGHQETEGEQYTFYTSDSSIAVEQWYHIAVAVTNGGLVEFYIDGVAAGSAEQSTNFGVLNDKPVRIGGRTDLYSYFNGLLDDIRLYDRALSQAEIKKLAARPKATKPDPADDALHEDIWVSLGWKAGDFAVSHDVYLGENFDDVNDGAADTFQGNQPLTSTTFIVGFFGFPYPDGLVPGTTYYWRIDEVNDTDPNSPWKGDVWSFLVPPKIAYNPNPADGAKFIDPNVDLNWTVSFGGKLHTVYFGDNFDDVNNAAEGLSQTEATYTPGPLELKKTYYWRVDEFDAVATYKGDVWSFTTAGLGGGVRADYYRGMDLRNLALTRIDPQISFNWGNGEPDPLVGADNFSVRWTGEVEVAFTETYTFCAYIDDGIRLWVDGQQLVENWIDQRHPIENKATIDLVAGNVYSLVMEYYENTGEAVAELRWSSPSTPKQLIPQAALSLPVRANRPNPLNGATNVKQTIILSWSPGDYAVSHQVYFGTDEEAVRNANTGSHEYKATKNLGSESYDPGKLAWDTIYYWRVDEVNNVNPDSPWIGNVWSFTTANFILVDDIEDYNDYPPDEIFSTWIDGWEVPTNGSLAGYADPPFAETGNVHGGRQSMPVYYENNFKYSEVTMTLVYPRDWTEEGVGVLSLWFYGDASNTAERMYVALNGIATVYHDNPDAALIDTWTEWTIDLQEFAAQGVNLANVNTISIGFGDKNNLQAGGSGMVLFDDIRLYRPAPELEPAP